MPYKIVLAFILGVQGTPPNIMAGPEDFATKEACAKKLEVERPAQNKAIAQHIPKDMQFMTSFVCIEPKDAPIFMARSYMVKNRFQANTKITKEELSKPFTEAEVQAFKDEVAKAVEESKNPKAKQAPEPEKEKPKGEQEL